MSEQDNIHLAEQAYEKFKSGDIEGLIGLMSDDINWRLPQIEGVSFSGARIGRDAVVEFFRQVADQQEALEFEPREFVAQGERVVSLGHYRWRVKATGREYSGDFAHVFTARGGKIVAFHEFTDTAAVAAAYQKAISA
jgi:ketosteroid isomerase-like protein